MKRLAREGGGRGTRERGGGRNRSPEVIGCEPSATNVASIEPTPLPIYVVFRNGTG